MGNKNELLINGEIDLLPESEKIRDFLSLKNISIRKLKEGEVLDIGSIIPLMISRKGIIRTPIFRGGFPFLLR